MKSRRTFEFLNVMRFVSAVWVSLFHMAASPLNTAFYSPPWDWLRKALLIPFSGLSAVMVFFVISGFCIHYPYATGKPLRLLPFYLQRFTRIGLPLVVALGVHHLSGTLPWLKNVLWAVYAEMIYYALYPLLRQMMVRLGTHPVLAGSFVLSWLFCLQPETNYGYIMAYGREWTWLVCLPAWLCGCVLADWFAGVTTIPSGVERLAEWIGRHLLLSRCGVLGLSSMLLLLGMRQVVVFKYSLPIFALVVLVWLLAEMRRPESSSWMARCGAAGYSIYLMHPLAEMPQLPQFAASNAVLYWAVRILLVVGVALVFYFVIERPSHWLARRLGAVRRTPLH